MGLNWNEIKSRALLFSKTRADASNEDSEAKPFWIAFFEIFGITDKRVATFELNLKKLGGAQGFVDLFWHGVVLVEHKSCGKNLDDAVNQNCGNLIAIPSHQLIQLRRQHGLPLEIETSQKIRTSNGIATLQRKLSQVS